MKNLLLLFFPLLITPSLQGQISAKLMKYMDVSDNHITFVYGGDIWISDKNNGLAIQLTNSPGEESWPKFSPDGNSIAYTASYNGNPDVYVISVNGGLPTRVTYKSSYDRMVEWHPDGKRLLMASDGDNGGRRLLNQFYIVYKDGGFPEKLPLPYGELASYSPDGKKLAYITKITENYPFKRIRSGNNSDIYVFDTETKKVENITNRLAIDGKPAWVGQTIYFLSDDNEDMRLNIWAYDTKAKTSKQITFFKDFDISYLSGSSKELVFENGGDLYLMDVSTQKYKSVKINVVSDFTTEMPQQKDVSKSITNMSMSPDGKRVIFESRGELFNVPAKDGATFNLTKSCGAFDHNPSWSPDGKMIAWWSDQSGEYEIWLQNTQGEIKSKQLTNRKKGFGYTLHWSPDNKYLAFLDEKNDISFVDVITGVVQIAGNTKWQTGHGSSGNFPISWSSDSKWLAFSLIMENANSAVFAYHLESKKLQQITSGFYSDESPTFSKDGKYLFFQTNRKMDAAYSGLNDGTWIYPNMTEIAVVSLQKNTASIIPVKNDTLLITKVEKLEKKDDTPKEEVKKEIVDMVIDVDNIEARIELLPVKAGNLGKMASIDGKLIYLRYPNTGSGENGSSLKYFDIKEREEKTILDKVGDFVVSSDGKSVLVSSNNQYAVLSIAATQKIEHYIPTDGLVMMWVAKQEWEQIFQDTWRRYRDFFYDPGMQNVNWNEMRSRYGALVKDARSRWDIINIQSSMISELAAGHTYARSGDTEEVKPRMTGFLGIDWAKEGNNYKIGRIIKPAAWDTEVRSPFDKPGVDILEGDIIRAVNGINLDINKDPYAEFEGLDGKTVSLTIIRKKETSEVSLERVVTCLSYSQERNLRYLEWIENNRQLIDKLSGGKLGYIYMSNTAGDGQRELVRMYYGQLDKKGFIIDERFNGGGQLADRFLELLKRPVVYNLHWRNGKSHTHPIKTNTGPMGMLINGWAGSGGDGLPWAFKELKAGPIVGENTLGILVGPATGHRLIDGGGITVPDARLYDNVGHWFWEGEGVSPDIRVWDDPNILMAGRDPQIERVVDEVMKLMVTQPGKMTPPPMYEDRTAKGLKNKK
ncbi:MAG: PDZ domain-containing protein [Saprospiraceae bacterium]